jgi:hypothetical protein
MREMFIKDVFNKGDYLGWGSSGRERGNKLRYRMHIIKAHCITV